jgi:hypothetical protein
MKIGQKVRVATIKDSLAKDARNKEGQMGVVKDFKMTDGSGVGVVVAFDDNTSSWFFEDELEGRR